MAQPEVAKVHGGLSEQAYKSQAEQVMSSGFLNEERQAYLDDIAKQMGLSKVRGGLRHCIFTDHYCAECSNPYLLASKLTVGFGCMLQPEAVINNLVTQ